MKNPQAFPECKWCDDSSIIKQGRIYLCKKHYRFQSMRASAKRKGKSVPTYFQLDQMLEQCKMICPGCQKEMVWRSKDDNKRVLSLQHDRSGLIRFLCRSCNTKHSAMPGDTFYKNKIPKDKKRCPSCDMVLPKTNFYKDISRYDNLKSLCKSCSDIKINDWRNSNKDAYNEYQRNYRSANN